MSSRAAFNVVLEDAIYQRGQFLTWPAKQKWERLERYKITCVVNLWSKVDPDLSSGNLGWTYLNWVCSPSVVPPDDNAYIYLLTKLIAAGGRVLIHCEAGRGRSVWLSTRLLASVEDISRPAALKIVESAIPSHNLTPTLRKDLST